MIRALPLLLAAAAVPVPDDPVAPADAGPWQVHDAVVGVVETRAITQSDLREAIFAPGSPYTVSTREEFDQAVEEEFRRAQPIIRDNIGRFEDSFGYFLERADLPPDVQGIGGGHCIAEAIIGGHQCTVEGYVFEGEMEIYGTVDSIREPNGSSFNRYEYPSVLPQKIQERIRGLSRTFIEHIGYDNGLFNIEYYWHEEQDRIWLLEANTRLSESHCGIFERVDGLSSHEIAVDVTTGRKPDRQPGRGEFGHAAKCFYRHYDNALVERVPTEDELAAIEKELPGTEIHLVAKEGRELSELKDQDSYSYVLALIWVGGKEREQLLEKFNYCMERMEFDLDHSV